MRIQQYNTRLDTDCKNVLVKEFEKDYPGEALWTPKAVVGVMNDVYHMQDRAEEYIYLIATTQTKKPIGFFELTHGRCSVAHVGMRELFIRALLCGAVAIFVVHNHPGGSVCPSKEDIALTQKIWEASNLLDIGLTDHIIIGRGGYYSFKDHWEELGFEEPTENTLD